jgi:hypothetical protein
LQCAQCRSRDWAYPPGTARRKSRNAEIRAEARRMAKDIAERERWKAQLIKYMLLLGGPTSREVIDAVAYAIDRENETRSVREEAIREEGKMIARAVVPTIARELANAALPPPPPSASDWVWTPPPLPKENDNG